MPFKFNNGQKVQTNTFLGNKAAPQPLSAFVFIICITKLNARDLLRVCSLFTHFDLKSYKL